MLAQESPERAETIARQRASLLACDGREPMPEWLAGFDTESAFDLAAFTSARVVYYPGSWTDGHAVEVFGGAGVAHAFVLADNGEDFLTTVRTRMGPAHERRFRGYETLAHRELGPDDVPIDCEADFYVLQRHDGLDDAHGPARLALLFVAAEGAATCEALFCWPDPVVVPPFAVLLQDHGFGGNRYAPFGEGRGMSEAARRAGALPEWLLIDDGTRPWAGYERDADAGSSEGGMHRSQRALWRRADPAGR